MRANPGGILASQDIIGRDKLIDHLWRVLETQSIVLTSERRIGKSSVIRKMADAPTADQLCFLRDVEGFRSPSEFIEGIYADVEPILSKKEKARLAIWGLLGKLGGTEIGHVKLPDVKTALERPSFRVVPRHLQRRNADGNFLLGRIAFVSVQRQGNFRGTRCDGVARFSRALRQEYSNLRMVFTDSSEHTR